jgi:hypothetical protein
MTRRTLMLDARVAINLAATADLERIADSLQLTFGMVQQAADEVGHLRDMIDGKVTLIPIDLTIPVANGKLLKLELDPPEVAVYLEMAAIVDDGEAATIAVAIHRGLAIATDDRRARTLCRERNLNEPVRTVALLHDYARAAHLTDHEIRATLASVRNRASFQPARTDPDIKWWNEHTSPS